MAERKTLVLTFPKRDSRDAVSPNTLAKLGEVFEMGEQQVVMFALAELRNQIWKFNRFAVRSRKSRR